MIRVARTPKPAPHAGEGAPERPNGARPAGYLPEAAAAAAPEHDFEPIPGLPEELPEGERILWQGRPAWRSLARRALMARTIAIYFGLLMLGRALMGWSDGHGALQILGDATALLPLALVSLGLLAAIAYAVAATTLYTITNRRVVMRIGILLQLTLNVPFKRIETAALAAYPDGSGELSLKLAGSDRFAYLLLWPHARAWRFAKPEPSLRCLPQAADVARTLADALTAYQAEAAAAAPAATQETQEVQKAQKAQEVQAEPTAEPTAEPIPPAAPIPSPPPSLGGLAAARG